MKGEVSNGNELAAEGLEKFLSLDEKQQYAFVEALKQPEKMLEAISETGQSTINVDGIEVPAKITEEMEVTSSNTSYPINIMGSRTVTASQSIYVGNLKVTTIYSQVAFNTSGSRATSIITGNHWHSNINPAMIWNKQTSGSQSYMGNNNTRAYHRGDWTVYATGALGFINDSVRFYVSGDAVSRSKQFYSTHPNWSDYSWRSF